MPWNTPSCSQGQADLRGRHDSYMDERYPSKEREYKTKPVCWSNFFAAIKKMVDNDTSAKAAHRRDRYEGLELKLYFLHHICSPIS